jgi:hypothetical protein
VNLKRAIFFAFTMALLAPAGAEPIEPAPTRSTAVSELYPQVSCTGTDANVNVKILQLAEDARDQLGSVLRLGNTWRFPVRIEVVMPDDPLADKIHEERATVTVQDKTMILDAAVPFSDPDAKAFIQRQFVTALLWEKFFASTHSFDTHTNLAVVPVWLIEGLNEWLDDDSGRDREAIVRRAALTHRAPTLNEITGWQDISQDRLLGLYQRAFCYYLINSLIHRGAQRDNFQQWLATFSSPNPTPARYLFPTEAGWQRQLLDAPERSHDIIYTWDESVAALSAAETISVPAKKAADARIYTLDEVAAVPRDSNLVATLQQKNFDLTALELRIHPSWRPIVALYRFGLTAIINDKPIQAKNYLAEARRRRAGEMAYHQKLTDYVNWFEVTKDFAGHTSHFDSYFSTAQAMERVQADPARPNPIRADLIQVESQL